MRAARQPCTIMRFKAGSRTSSAPCHPPCAFGWTRSVVFLNLLCQCGFDLSFRSSVPSSPHVLPSGLFLTLAVSTLSADARFERIVSGTDTCTAGRVGWSFLPPSAPPCIEHRNKLQQP